MATDLAAHADVLGLIGNLARDAGRVFFQAFVPQLLAHVMRLLNICVHVIESESRNGGTADREDWNSRTLKKAERHKIRKQRSDRLEREI